MTHLLALCTLTASLASPGPAGSPPIPVLSQGRWDPEVHQGLQQMIVEHGATSPGYDAGAPPVAVLDWDNTCIRGDVGESLLQVMDAGDGGDRMGTYERMCEEQGDVPCYTYAAAVVAGLTELQARELAQRTIETVLDDGRVVLRPEMRELVWALQRHGWEVWVVSASVYPAVQAFAQRYGVAPDHVVGVRLAVDERGILQDSLAEPLTYRQGKVEAIDRHVGRRPLFAAGDTLTDLEMIRSARYRLLLDRGVEEMRRIAREEGWWIQPGL